MKNLKFLVLEGDGIGPEITKSSIDVLKAALAIFDLKVDLIYEDIGLVRGVQVDYFHKNAILFFRKPVFQRRC